MATLLDRTGRGQEAEKLAHANLEQAGRSLGADDPITLDAAERLGTILWHLGKAEMAESVLRKNVADRGRVLTPEHPDTLRSVYLLSRVLRDLKSFADAEKFAYDYAHSVQCSLGSNHPDHVVAISESGRRVSRQGRSGAGPAVLWSGSARSPGAAGCRSRDHPGCGGAA